MNGENTFDLYKFLKTEVTKAEVYAASEGLSKQLQEHGFSTAGVNVKWNFVKFLVDINGKVVARYAPTYEPEKLEEILKLYLKNNNIIYVTLRTLMF